MAIACIRRQALSSATRTLSSVARPARAQLHQTVRLRTSPLSPATRCTRNLVTISNNLKETLKKHEIIPDGRDTFSVFVFSLHLLYSS